MVYSRVRTKQGHKLIEEIRYIFFHSHGKKIFVYYIYIIFAIYCTYFRKRTKSNVKLMLKLNIVNE